MELREPTADEGERIAELVDSSMTTSFRLSPEQIDKITDAEFGEEALSEKVEDDDRIVRVVETDEGVDEPVVAGYVEGNVDEEWGELNWLFVDPEHMGEGIGTELYESGMDELEERGAEKRRATVLEANTEGDQFLEKFGLEEAGERRVELADESLVKYEYVEPGAGVETSPEHETEGDAEEQPDVSELDMPGTEEAPETYVAETDDGRTLYLDTDDRESGTEGPFFGTYLDGAFTDRYGYYCSNCGSVDITMDSGDRIECQECGNSHAERSSEAYDDSYL